MNILGVGPLELIFIFLIAIIVLGPKDIVKASQTMGRWLRTIIRSDTWRIIRQTAREIRTIPTKMMNESGISDISKSIPSEAELKQAMGYDELQKESTKISADISNLTNNQTITPLGSTSNIYKQSAIKPPTNQEPPSSDWTTPRPKIIQPETPPDNAVSSEPNLPESSSENRSDAEQDNLPS
jgi:Sec-independent protein translocase protein TatA